jgi:hypothetical protein
MRGDGMSGTREQMDHARQVCAEKAPERAVLTRAQEMTCREAWIALQAAAREDVEDARALFVATLERIGR